MMRLLAPEFDAILLTRYRHNQRGVSPDDLAATLQRIRSMPVEVHPDAITAWQSAWKQAKPNDLVVVTGSVFLAGELRPEIIRSVRGVELPNSVDRRLP